MNILYHFLQYKYLMKKQNVLTTCAFLLTVATMSAQEDVSDLIVNPGFEQNGFAGWVNKGFQAQTNAAPSSQGWDKEGKIYVEKWSSTAIENGSVTQVVEGLPDGYYVLRADAHAVLQSSSSTAISGVSLFAGNAQTAVSKGGTYKVGAVVANGKLKIGFKVDRTNANWVAVDNFRLARVDTSGVVYRTYMRNLRDDANALVKELNRLKYHVPDGMKEVLKKMALLTTNDVEVLMGYAKTLQPLLDECEALRPHCDLLKAKIIAVIANLKRTEYQGHDVLAVACSKAGNVLLSSSDAAEIDAAAVELQAALDVYLKNRPSEWVTIQNGLLWKTNTGATVQAHAPGFVRVGDVWYMAGEDRSNWWNPDVNLYSSTDLVNWKFEKKIIQNGVTDSQLGNGRMIERAKLMYNQKTGKYVVWCHWESSNYGASEAACFECDSVNGAYKIIWSGRPRGVKSRDCNIFLDNDGTAYFVSTTEENRHLGLFRLDDEYKTTVSHTQLFSNQSREAPAIVRVADRYFMFSSACSGWDPNQCKLSFSNSLTGGWSGLANVGNSIAYDTQAAAILEVSGTKATTYLYVGDRWQDSGLPETKTIVFPVSFSGTSCNFKYHERFDINFATGEWRETPTDDVFADKKGWKVIACSSEETSSENGRASNAIDGNVNTKWHTRYSGTAGTAPHSITVDMGKNIWIKGFLATPRMDGSSNGLIRKYKFEVSEDGETWKTVASGSWLLYCTETDFASALCRYIRLTCTEGSYASLAELDVVLDQEKTTAIGGVDADAAGKTVKSCVYYTLGGKQVAEPERGIYIERLTYTDGTTSSVKRYRK